jgi:hypothetical protein
LEIDTHDVALSRDDISAVLHDGLLVKRPTLVATVIGPAAPIFRAQSEGMPVPQTVHLLIQRAKRFHNVIETDGSFAP